jgi:hypothetical protein
MEPGGRLEVLANEFRALKTTKEQLQIIHSRISRQVTAASLLIFGVSSSEEVQVELAKIIRNEELAFEAYCSGNVTSFEAAKILLLKITDFDKRAHISRLAEARARFLQRLLQEEPLARGQPDEARRLNEAAMRFESLGHRDRLRFIMDLNDSPLAVYILMNCHFILGNEAQELHNRVTEPRHMAYLLIRKRFSAGSYMRTGVASCLHNQGLIEKVLLKGVEPCVESPLAKNLTDPHAATRLLLSGQISGKQAQCTLANLVPPKDAGAVLKKAPDLCDKAHGVLKWKRKGYASSES